MTGEQDPREGWWVDAPAVVPTMPNEVYHADPVRPEPSMSAGLGHTIITRTPLHAWTGSRRLNPRYEPENSETFDVGRVFHGLMTGQIEHVVVVSADSWRTNAAKAARDDAYSRGATPLLTHEHERVKRMHQAARDQLRAANMVRITTAGQNEVSLFWQAEGVWNRARPDHLVQTAPGEGGVIYDWKTTADTADPQVWVKRAIAFGLDLRAALYTEGAAALYGGRWLYRFIPIEKEPPHALSILELDESALEFGRRKLAEARRIWRECVDANRWPAFPSLVSVVSAPAWAETEWLRREERNEALRARSPDRRLIDSAIAFQAPAGA